MTRSSVSLISLWSLSASSSSSDGGRLIPTSLSCNLLYVLPVAETTWPTRMRTVDRSPFLFWIETGGVVSKIIEHGRWDEVAGFGMWWAEVSVTDSDRRVPLHRRGFHRLL